jgi:hypothetical protein
MANTLKFGNGEWYGKKDTILAYNDLNSNYKPLPFNFSRASKATFVNKDGLIEEVGSGEPRIDYKDDSKGALLLEPSRSNLITYSENLNGSGWSNTGATITENQSISPDGSLNADLIELDSNLDRLAAVLGSTGGTYTFSFYIKAKEGESGVWRTRVNGDSTLWQNTQVNDTEWTRVTQTFTKTGSGNIVVYPAYRVDGTSTLFNAYIYGAQLESGSYATSYIPTSGSAVTRLADICNNGGNSNVFNSTEGVLYFEGSVLNNDLTYRQISLAETPSGNDVLTLDYSSNSNGIRTYFRVNGATYSLSYVLTNSTENAKIAVRYTDTLSLWVNGVQVASTPTPAVTTNFDNLSFDNGSGGGNFYGKTKDVRVYNTALTDSELAALTQV